MNLELEWLTSLDQIFRSGLARDPIHARADISKIYPNCLFQVSCVKPQVRMAYTKLRYCNNVLS